ncbi:MAG: hypothetical protein WAW54_11785 [Parvibaculum sedimenti]|uniref:hypothetical protein n=1 Tax=Parvibaculum sedimenti TaxID=2608632 RepID=UPI003BB5876F
MSAHLIPAISDRDMLPADAAFMARTDLTQTRMLGYTPLNIDAVTTHLMGLLGERPSVRHVSGATDEILTILEAAGLQVVEDIRRYESGAEAERQADALIAEGYRLFSPYPLPRGRYPENAQLVPPALWVHLNSKENLGDLVDPAHLPERKIMTFDEVRARKINTPVWLKAAGDEATGWGYAVRHCTDATGFDIALSEMRKLDTSDRVIVEEHVPVTDSWCASIIVHEDRTLYAGSAEQVFSCPGHQSGSLIDPANLLPDPNLAIAVGEAARKRGFLGIAGMDIGQTVNGRTVVFDPNFRFNSSTSQALLHPAAAARARLPVSLSLNLMTTLSMAEIARRLREPIDDLWFVPTRLVDAARLSAANGRSIVTGFVLAENRDKAFATQAVIAAMLDTA